MELNTTDTPSILKFTETESRLAFASLCVECAARRLGRPPREMYLRLKRVGLINQIAHRTDPLHTQSREYITRDIVDAVLRLEAQQSPDPEGGKPC